MNRIFLLSLLILIGLLMPKTTLAYPPDYKAPWIELQNGLGPNTTKSSQIAQNLFQNKNNNLLLAGAITSVIFLLLLGFFIRKKKVQTNSTPIANPSPLTNTGWLTRLKQPKILIALVAVTVVAVTVFFYTVSQKSKTPKIPPKPSPTSIPTSQERISLLKLLPIEAKGEYIFEYLPESQFFYLRIENAEKNVQIRQEIADKIKGQTTDGDYCKFGVVVWSPNKDASAKLPGC